MALLLYSSLKILFNSIKKNLLHSDVRIDSEQLQTPVKVVRQLDGDTFDGELNESK